LNQESLRQGMAENRGAERGSGSRQNMLAMKLKICYSIFDNKFRFLGEFFLLTWPFEIGKRYTVIDRA